MKIFSYVVITFFAIAVLLVGCAKKEQAKKELVGWGGSTYMYPYSVDTNQYPKPSAKDTTASAKDEMVTCSYDKMEMKKSAMEAQMLYKGKTLYFCTKAEMEKFKKNPEGYLSGKVKPKLN
jgi:YHS domain-containing protein